MNLRSRTITTLAVTAAAVVALSACSSGSTGGDSAASDDAFSVTLVGGTAGDLSYTDTTLAGLAAVEAEGVKTNHIEVPDVSQGETLLRSAVQTSPDLILSITLPVDTLISIAEQYPNQLIISPDASDEGDELPDNLAAYQINVHEGSFLAGLVAGSITESKVVGAVLGGDAPGLNQFGYAYKQGVLAACADCTVNLAYLNFEFTNPDLGKSTANDLHSDGADVIFQVAGGTGIGVIEAAEEGGFYAIGVDSNQDDVAPGTVVTSVMKRVDQTVELAVEAAEAGDVKPGFTKVGLAEGATGLSWDEGIGSTTFEDSADAAMKEKVTAAKALVEEYRAQILDGSYEVCDALNAPDSDACAAVAN
ncbi:BMP family ABC transporter substrate-binding protein [Amnibacterium flavum]|uniref:BMP family ABC transporter substrate-binding protein n=1 Tax=Amnibacterium flavum TaxID=2173173 RepID=A0A2V1HQJ6_9MICO|nr:BMP family ABC transporter substrate-binding protein [Amnibacterium flavum]PVZ93399.1 BMP family ABC transporter substrate-binding protein [Amnibacterium flavum]